METLTNLWNAGKAKWLAFDTSTQLLLCGVVILTLLVALWLS